MNDLIELQSQMMRALGIEWQANSLPLDLIREAAIGANVEAAEVLDPLNKANRPWKPRTLDKDHVQEEIVDIMFYVLELFVLFGMSWEDVIKAYKSKIAINCARVIEALLSKQEIDLLFVGMPDIERPRNVDIAFQLLISIIPKEEIDLVSFCQGPSKYIRSLYEGE